MKLSLGQVELRVLVGIFNATGDEHSVSSLAAEIGISKSQVSRACRTLQAKGFVELKREGKRITVEASPTPQSRALAELFAANPHIKFENVLSCSAMRVLAGMAFNPTRIAQIAYKTATPEITVRRTVSKLQESGIVKKAKPAHYEIAIPRLKEFVTAYLQYVATTQLTEANITGSLITSGPHCLVRTNAKDVSKQFTSTGLSVFSNYGVKIIQTDFRDYYFNIFAEKKKISMEEALVHALARASLIQSAREVSYVLLVIAKNWKKLNNAKFLATAGEFNILAAAKQCIEFAEAIKANRPTAYLPLIFPGKEEFQELSKQYE